MDVEHEYSVHSCSSSYRARHDIANLILVSMATITSDSFTSYLGC